MNEILAFVHIPKTAGTSARVALENAAGKDQTLSIGPNLKLEQFAQLTPQDLTNTKVLFGHAHAQQFRTIGARFRFAATVRNPIERAASYFNFMRERRSDSSLAKQIGDMTLLEASRSVQPFINEISDLQCRMICGEADASKAAETIQRENWFIARQNDLNGLVRTICDEYGWNWSPAPTFNVGRKGYKRALLDRETHEQIAQLNQEDQKLLAFVVSRRREETNT